MNIAHKTKEFVVHMNSMSRLFLLAIIGVLLSAMAFFASGQGGLFADILSSCPDGTQEQNGECVPIEENLQAAASVSSVTCSVSADPNPVQRVGDITTMRWSSTGASSVEVSINGGAPTTYAQVNNTVNISITSNRQYYFKFLGSNGDICERFLQVTIGTGSGGGGDCDPFREVAVNGECFPISVEGQDCDFSASAYYAADGRRLFCSTKNTCGGAILRYDDTCGGANFVLNDYKYDGHTTLTCKNEAGSMQWVRDEVNSCGGEGDLCQPDELLVEGVCYRKMIIGEPCNFTDGPYYGVSPTGETEELYCAGYNRCQGEIAYLWTCPDLNGTNSDGRIFDPDRQDWAYNGAFTRTCTRTSSSPNGEFVTDQLNRCSGGGGGGGENTCNNNRCDPEDLLLCPQECGGGGFCGDSICGVNEDARNCYVDCGVCSLSANPSTVAQGGQNSVLSWIPGGDQVKITPPGEFVNQSSSTPTYTVTPEQTTTYTLSIFDNGQVVDQCATTVQVPSPVLTSCDSFTAFPEITTQSGEEVSLRWTASNAQLFRLRPDPNEFLSADVSGFTVYPEQTTTYTLDVYAENNPQATPADSCEVTVLVQNAPDPEADVQITRKNATNMTGEAYIAPGNDRILFDVYYRNNGPDIAHQVVITDTYDASLLEIQEFYQEGCEVTQPGQFQCRVPDTAPMAEHQSDLLLRYRAKVLDQSPIGPTTNMVVITSTVSDPNPNNNSAQETIDIRDPGATYTDIALEKWSLRPTVPSGDETTYFIRLTNTQEDTIQRLEFQDTYNPQLISFHGLENYNSQNIQCGTSSAEGKISCFLDTPLSGGQSIEISYVAEVSGDVAEGTVIENEVRLVQMEPQDVDPSNNRARAVVYVHEGASAVADLSIAKSVSRDWAYQGQSFTYTLEYQNIGDQMALQAQIRDIFDDSKIEIISTPQELNSQGCALEESGDPIVKSIFCDLGDVPPHTTRFIRYQARGKALGEADNQARIFGSSFDPDMSNNVAQAQIEIREALPVCRVFTASLNALRDNFIVTWQGENIVNFDLLITHPDGAISTTENIGLQGINELFAVPRPSVGVYRLALNAQLSDGTSQALCSPIEIQMPTDSDFILQKVVEIPENAQIDGAGIVTYKITITNQGPTSDVVLTDRIENPDQPGSLSRIDEQPTIVWLTSPQGGVPYGNPFQLGSGGGLKIDNFPQGGKLEVRYRFRANYRSTGSNGDISYGQFTTFVNEARLCLQDTPEPCLAP